ncbi:MAG: DAK2 domain-containing protein [Actinomycetota bacterium]
MNPEFGPDDFRRSIVAALASLRVHQAAIDECNVYPVADGDTGTNMVLTMTAASEGLESEDPFSSVPQAALQGARGNSGVILAQILRGFCDGAREGDLAGGLVHASELAYQAVLEPVEGTILTVIRVAAEHAKGTNASEILERAAAGARLALDATPDQLPLLREAGVLDSGGIGMWVILDSFAATASGREPSPPPEHSSPRLRKRESGSPQFAYEVQYLLEAPLDKIDVLRSKLGSIGDSVVVSGGAGLWNVHVHTNDIEAAVSMGLDLGVVRAEAISAFADQMSGSRAVPLSRSLAPVTVIVVAHGEGFTSLYSELGASTVIDGGPSMDPSAQQIADEIERVPSSDVIVLPNSQNAIHASCDAVEMIVDKRVVIIETHDLAQGVATMLAYGDARDLDTNANQMRQAASVAATARIVMAVDDAITPAGVVRSGQWIGDGADVQVLADDPISCAIELVNAIDVDEPVEVVTIFAGADAPLDERSQIESVLKDQLVGVDVEMRDGGQAVERYLISVE